MPATSLGALLINAAAARERIKEATIPACPTRQREAAVFEVEMLDQTRLAQASSDLLGRFVLGFEGLNERKAHQIRKPDFHGASCSSWLNNECTSHCDTVSRYRADRYRQDLIVLQLPYEADPVLLMIVRDQGHCTPRPRTRIRRTRISAVSQPRSEALRPSRDSGEGFRATAHAHDCKFREADWHSLLPQLPGNLGSATWLSSRLSP